jgi:hypothetical protein
VQLQGWSRARRAVFVRTIKPVNPSSSVAETVLLICR